MSETKKYKCQGCGKEFPVASETVVEFTNEQVLRALHQAIDDSFELAKLRRVCDDHTKLISKLYATITQLS